MRKNFYASLLLPIFLVASVSLARAQTPTRGLDKINHVVVIFMENWTFDAHYGLFPGANGLNVPDAKIIQVDKDGVTLQSLVK